MREPHEMQALVRQIVGLCMKVHRYFGPGRNEKIYENALAIEFRKAGISAVFQATIDTYYEDEFIGREVIDCLVDDELVIEFKAVDTLVAAHEAQIVSYLNSSRKEVGLLVNFGSPSLQFRTKDRQFHPKRGCSGRSDH